MTTILSTTYCGPVQWYQKLYRSDLVLMECHETFQKQTYRNRCVIATTNGPQTLTVPVDRGTSPFIRDIRISNHGNWRHQHWHALMSAYNESPFFDYYQDDFRPFFEQQYNFLYDFNTEICQKVCELIDIQPNIRETTSYRSSGVLESKGVKGSQRPLPSDANNLSTESPSLREGLGVGSSSLIPHPSSKIRSADNSLRLSDSKVASLSGFKDHTTSQSESNNLSTCQLVNLSTELNDFRSSINPKHPDADAHFIPRRYYQVYERKHGFQPNLSIIDLLFNMGPESIFWL